MTTEAWVDAIRAMPTAKAALAYHREMLHGYSLVWIKPDADGWIETPHGIDINERSTTRLGRQGVHRIRIRT